MILREVVYCSMCGRFLRVGVQNDLEFGTNIDVTTYVDGERQTHNLEGRAHASTVWEFFQVGIVRSCLYVCECVMCCTGWLLSTSPEPSYLLSICLVAEFHSTRTLQ